MERIICAAIWYKELPTQTFLPKNITQGIIVCGIRHPHCIDIVRVLSGKRTVQIAPDGVGKTKQGFYTNLNRFVDRTEARQIALAAGQIEDDNTYSTKELYSEDIY